MRRNIAVAFALVIIGCVTLLTGLAFLHSREVLGAVILGELRAILANTALQIEQELDSARKDVLALSGMPPVRGLLRARQSGGFDAETQSSYAMWAGSFEQTMAALLENNPDYLRVRFIDEQGFERVRVDQLGGSIRAVPANPLERETGYPYFGITIKLPPGTVHLSPIGLYRENGRIDAPYRPSLHIATPIYDVSNRQRGVIVIDLDAQILARRILARLQDLKGQAYLVDQKGVFLTHPDPAGTVRFNLDHDYRLDRIHPRLAARLGESEGFAEIVEGGESPGAEAHVHGFQKIAYDALDARNYWAIVFEVPNAIALEPIRVERNRLLALGFVIALLGSIAAFFWSGRLTRPLKDLTATARHIASGHYDRRVDLPRERGELHELSRAFNQMVDALVTSERRLANILDAAGDAIISVDQQQRIIAFNNTAAQIFGYAAPDILGRPLGWLLPEGTAAVHRKHFLAYGQEEGTNRRMGAGREVAGRRSDGSTFPAEVSISKTSGSNSPIFTAILRDITDRKRAETERSDLVADLRKAVTEANRSRAQLEAVFEAMEDGIAVLDMQGDLILLNEAEARINGFASTEEMKRNLAYFAEIYELSEPDGRAVLVDEWPASKCLRGESVSNWVLHGRRMDTEQEWVFRFSGAPIHDAEGQQVLAAVVTRDITEFKKAENEILRLNAELEQRVLERTAELEAANKELEAFSYSVSHDLRAPLRAIDGFSQALLEDYGGRLDESGQRYLKRVRAASMRMADLIDDMLKLSRVTRAEIRHQAVDLSALADSVVGELKAAEPDRSVDIALQTGLEVEGDPQLLRIALVNLLSNAWKFTKLEPSPRIELGSLDTEAEPRFYVRDNGVGFDMTYSDKLFGAFQRLHTENEFPGTGIGLAIVQRIIHRHGGRVWAKSAINQGSTFYFTIPPPHHLERGHDVHEKNSIG